MVIYDDEETILFGLGILEEQAAAGSAAARELLQSLSSKLAAAGEVVRVCADCIDGMGELENGQ